LRPKTRFTAANCRQAIDNHIAFPNDSVRSPTVFSILLVVVVRK